MARYLLRPPTAAAAAAAAASSHRRNGTTSPRGPVLGLRALASRAGKARPVMAVASEQPAARGKCPKVAAPTTGPIPAAELLGVIQDAARAGAEVRSRFFAW